MKNMKRDDIMKKLYVGLDIRKEEFTRTMMGKQGGVVLSGEFSNSRDAVQGFFTGIPSPQVTIAIEARSICSFSD
jgi:hypothetical protein